MQRLWRKKQNMTLLQKQNTSMTSCALRSPNSLRKTVKQKLVDIQALDLQLESIQQQCS